jgi:tRNA G18 (ribose-2'-O)-methylase SpoU
VFRTSDAFRVQKIVLCGITATPPNTEIHKTALGAEDVVEWQYFQSTDEAVAMLREEGYRIYSIELCDGSIALQNFNTLPGERYAVILGNEVKGVQQSVVDASDGAIEIPQFGTKHSLNVSVTAGMVIWEFANKLGWVE